MLWVLQILIAGFFLTAASACELAGAVGLLIPRVTGVAASGLVAMMFGACCFLVFVLDTPQLVVTPIILAVPLTFIARKRLPDTDLSPRVAFVH